MLPAEFFRSFDRDAMDPYIGKLQQRQRAAQRGKRRQPQKSVLAPSYAGKGEPAEGRRLSDRIRQEIKKAGGSVSDDGFGMSDTDTDSDSDTVF